MNKYESGKCNSAGGSFVLGVVGRVMQSQRERAYEYHKAGLTPAEIERETNGEIKADTVRKWLRRHWSGQDKNRTAKQDNRTVRQDKTKSDKPAQNRAKSAADNAGERDFENNTTLPGGQPGNANAAGNSGGAPHGNSNAVTHGAYRRVSQDVLSGEELAIIDEPGESAEDVLRREQKLLLVRELRLLQYIKEVRDAGAGRKELVLGSVSKSKIKREGGKFQGVEDMLMTTEDALFTSLRIYEGELTRVQRELARNALELAKLLDLRREGAELGGRYAGLPASAIGRAYADINRDIDTLKYAQYDFKGGRGSLKSSFIALKIIDRLMLNSTWCALAVRALHDDLRRSVYNQIVWALDYLDLTHLFKCSVSPLEITRRDTGQKIYFMSAEAGKIKSIKPPSRKA